MASAKLSVGEAIRGSAQQQQQKGRDSMALDALQQFLTLRLLNIGAEDARRDFILKASSELAADLQKTPRQAVDFALASLDSQVAADHPAMAAAARAIEVQWKTYRGAFDDTPVSLFRAMIAEALAQAGEKNDKIAASFAYLARNRLPGINLGAEGPIWRDLISTAEAQLEAAAEAAWSTQVFDAPKLSFKVPAAEIKVTKAKADLQGLTSNFGAAAGPHGADGTGYPNANQQWSNNGAQWSYEFAPRAAKAVATAIDQIAITAEVDLNTPMKAMVDSVTTFGKALASANKTSAEGLQRRTTLLWWKEALYSSSANRSYRQLTPAVAAARMAGDLFKQIPTFHPVSVEYFLREAVRSLPHVNDDPTPMSSWIDAIRQEPETEDIQGLAAKYGVAAEGDLALGGLGGGALTPSLAAVTISAPDFAVWLLRELQALHATHETP